MTTLTQFPSQTQVQPAPQPKPVAVQVMAPPASFSRKKKFSIYKPNRSMKGSAVQFDFNPSKESIFVELANQVPNPSGSNAPGDNKFDWQNKLTVKLGLIDIGKLLLVLSGNPKFPKADLFHDPQKSYEANEVDVSADPAAHAKKNATVNFSTMQSGFFLKVSIQQKDGKISQVGVPVTDDEGALLKVLLEQAVRRSFDW